MSEPLTIAVSKGRVLKDTLPLLAAAGIELAENPEESRRLILSTRGGQVRILQVRTSDVPTYVEHGAAHLGIVGKDVLLEHDGSSLYEPLDLDLAHCRLMVARPVGAERPARRLRVATKFIASARRHYAAQGIQVELIKLYGSVELGPLVGLSDEIVDLVDTGNTLRANGLEPVETVADISARLVVNKAAMKTRYREIRSIVDAMGRVVRERAADRADTAEGTA
ncbi:ATP phosphoribosyltransferase [Natronospira proteinivora]|uniref:ATP phosphoribosyltransferase n=1 Tax=Natronospira proteinivora TaxID=1807133 RepID=A0ABT1G6Z3_9GAMM|nr:ATP phosphoribosyltransferase [Natronospira proteinivora]MCP1726083.1 ATP phosphoribosyltransferase [Natronospira proteinivora]